MTPAEFAASLEDPDWMEAHVFDRLPVAEIQEILQAALPRSVDLLLGYFHLA
jgi:hypothetical protein